MKNLIKDAFESMEKCVNPKVNLTLDDFETLQHRPIYFNFLDDNYSSIKIELSDDNYIVTMYYDGFIYDMNTYHISEFDNMQRLSNLVNSLIVLYEIYTYDINAYKKARYI